MSEDTNRADMESMVSRTERIINALTGAHLATAEIAAEKIELACRVAQARQRSAAFMSVLEAVGAQKAVLLEHLGRAAGPMRSLIQQQLALLTAQETEVLVRAGVPTEVAQQAVATVDEDDMQAEPMYKRSGRRFVPLTNGNAAH